jgi:hypothetical protein
MGFDPRKDWKFNAEAESEVSFQIAVKLAKNTFSTGKIPYRDNEMNLEHLTETALKTLS